MKIDNFIDNTIYEKNGVLHLKGHDQFGYSDGDKTENYIYETIKLCSDISSSSRELESHIKDWASLYHFSRKRSLAYQSLNIPNTAKVLEVGCGCGAITRHLGERAEFVLALEGSHRRAQIARERTRELKTTEVLCAPFDNVNFTDKFDLVVCNGVLEYASMFTPGDHPHTKLLSKFASLLKNEGTLIVAIENKFGLRYLSSAKEEHTNIMYDGIEGYPRRGKGARTFGTKELQKMLKNEFSNVDLLLPIPDYKLPTAIIRDSLIDNATCNELFANLASNDIGSFVPPILHERLIWSELESSELLKDFSNSLFFVCSNEKIDTYEPNWMGDIYSLQRNPQWATRTRIISSEGTIKSKKEYLNAREPSTNPALMRHTLCETPWVNGSSTHTQIARTLCSQAKAPLNSLISAHVTKWWEAIEPMRESSNALKGEAIDVNWQNVILDSNTQQAVCIDNEWALNETVTPSWLIFRTVNKFFAVELYYVHRWDKKNRSLSPYKMTKTVSDIFNENYSLKTLYTSIKKEVSFQRATRGVRISPIAMLLLSLEPIGLRQKRKIASTKIRSINGRLRSLFFR